MSFPVRVQCAAGCGSFGDADLELLCVACHGDRVELRQHQELKDYMKQHELTDFSTDDASATAAPSGSPSRRAPPSIDHHKALEDFLARPRERNAAIIERELEFLQRQLAIRDTSVAQMRKYMVASDSDEQVDPKEWGRYQYGAPRPVPRHTVDRAAEVAAQVRLFYAWRQRTVRRRLEAERQRREQATKGQRRLPRSLSPRKRQSTVTNSAVSSATQERRLFPSIWRKEEPKK